MWDLFPLLCQVRVALPSVSGKALLQDIAATRYVPPHLRDAVPSDEDSEKLAKLSRQLKGLLNRLGEQNIAGILSDIEELYRQNRRHDVTSSISSLIIDSISTHSSLLDSYVVLHAAFISSLHKIVGVEFAAYFIQNVVSTYEHHYSSFKNAEGATLREDETQGKECSNLIVLLSELYNFQVISCILIYDIIRSLLDKELTEFSVELLLKLLRNSGQQLRQDDPSALKDVVQIVQNKTSGSQEASSSRTQFMIETLINLKNNKVKRSATQHAGGDAVERMKKFLSGLAKRRHVASNEPLRVSLADLHSSESKGKWWLVGAAWGGDPLVDRQATANRPAAPSADDAVENALLELAKKQGMNTDIRRNIFVVLMSSDDFVDACERLAQLSLTEIQQREVVRVILHCCGNEKTYNPYYAFVCQRLCQTSHAYKVTLQFCLWDFLRDLGETNVGGAEIIKSLKDDDAGFAVKSVSPTRLRNVAKAYAWWVAKDCVTLAIYKPVDFTSLKTQTQKFMTEFHRHLFLNSQSSAPVLSSDTKNLLFARKKSALEEIFIKATRIETLAAGLAYFLPRTFKLTASEDPETVFMAWASGVAVETLRTGIPTP
ncbi:ARM repeat-containing protein [Auriscalpium vulgare]|uniref:ARM repeat-containing protein n=1 Tax=Auriscalpium vulgare TaxID=40419 RepID=A0ACB8R276_9AGAM|nr:ARM repeat-containing protein [Auriscalpium vulgare]